MTPKEVNLDQMTKTEKQALAYGIIKERDGLTRTLNIVEQSIAQTLPEPKQPVPVPEPEPEKQPEEEPDNDE